MAFIIPSIVALGLTELGATAAISGTVAEVVGSEVIGTAVAGAAVGETSKYIGDKVNNEIVNTVGQENLNSASNTLEDAKNTFEYFIGGDPNNLSYLHRVHKPDTHTITPAAPSVPTVRIPADISNNGAVTDIVIKQIKGLVSGQDPVRVVTDTVTDKEQLDTFSSINNYYTSSNNSVEELYAKIKEVYNGSFSKPYETQVYEGADYVTYFNWMDELKQSFSMKSNDSWFSIPTLKGTFTGPMSANNKLPARDSNYIPGVYDHSDYVDQCAMLHDEGYGSKGYFDSIEDLKLVARLENGFEKGLIPESDKFLANSMIKYFKTIAFTNLKLKGSLPPVLLDIPQSVITDDYYGSTHQEEAMNYPEKFKLDQYNFYKDLDKNFYEHSSTSSMLNNTELLDKVIYRNILNAFGSLEIINE